MNTQGLGTRSLFVVGDDAQSIYGFRGSKIEIILNFEKQYAGTNEILLNQNYRSTQPILDLAENVLSHNPHQKKKSLFTDNKETKHVNYYLAHNEKDESEFIIRQIHELYSSQSSSPNNNDFESSDPAKESLKAKFSPQILSKLKK